MEIIKTLKQIPVLRILFPLILGLIVANYTAVNNLLLIIVAAFLFLMSIFFVFLPTFRRNISLQKIYGICLSTFFLVSGILLLNFEQQKQKSNEQQIFSDSTHLLKVNALPVEKNKTFQVKTSIVSKVDSQFIGNSDLGIILYIAKEDSCVRNLMPGDILITNSKINQIQNKNNPDEFDYKGFINRRGYSHTAYLKAKSYFVLKNSESKSFEYKIAHLRLSILNHLRANYDEETYALLSSMLIGVKDDLDEETRNSFSASGITHLLAISGLHVGILYLVLTYLFSFVGNSFTLRLTKNTVIIIVLWMYAILAGLSPSVVRATIMFTVIVVGELLSRKTTVYNSLAFAALLMLVLNPNNLFEVGFQLSFLAVLGIVYFQPRINNMIKTNNSVLSFLWGLISVSIAAQLATFPLTVFYFHQFPNYFILGNLLAIPLFFLDLIFGLIYISLGWIPLLGTVIQIATEFLSGLILKVSNFVSELRFSVTDGLFINKLQVLFIYLALIFLAYFLAFKQGKYLINLLGCILFVILITIYNKLENSNNRELIIYNNQATIISYTEGTKSYNFMDSATLFDSKYNFTIKDYLIKQNAYKNRKLVTISEDFKNETFGIQQLNGGNKLICFENNKLLFLKENNMVQFNKKPQLSFLVLEDDINTKIKDLNKNFEFDKIVFAASNKSWNISNWKLECEELGIDYFSIPESGAFLID